MKQYYENNADFRRYVDSYAKQRNLSIEECFSHALVLEVYNYYRDEDLKKAI